MISTSEFVDIARTGTASQSSLSRWSAPTGAQAAVEGDFSRDFTIHTDVTDELPWWTLDLRSWYPVEAIIVRNRKNPRFWDLARKIRIEASEDGKAWTLLHAGFVHFGPDDNNALSVPLSGQLPIRFVRISLDERKYLHLNRVQVLVRPETVRDRALMRSIGIDFSSLTRYSHGAVKPETYRVLGERTPDGKVSGLKVVRSGRFANNVFQMARALQIAIKYELDFVQMIESDQFDFSRPADHRAPWIIPPDAPLPAGATVVEGDFFYTNRLTHALDLTRNGSPHTATIARSYLGPFLRVPELTSPPPADELLVHVRSGDLFGDKPHPRYGQPPLTFYALAIERALAIGFRRIRIVAEDRLNPIVDALEHHLAAAGIPVVMQVGEELGTDLATLLAARGLVFGVGTFGSAICMLSSKAEVVFEASRSSVYRHSFPHLDVVSVRLTGAYGPFAQWDNSPEQISEMLTYPASALQIVDKADTDRHIGSHVEG